MTTTELIEKHGIGHNCLSDAYELGRANGYSQAENDYHKQTEKDRQSAYDCGYELGRKDAIDEIHTELITEIAMLNEAGITDTNLYTFAIRIREITNQLKEKNNDNT